MGIELAADSHASNVFPAGLLRRAASGLDRRLVAPGGFFGEQDAQYLGGVPALRRGGRDDLGGGATQIWEPQAPQESLELRG